MSSSPYQIVATSKAPSALGPYSQAIRTKDLIFCSGSLGLDPSNGNLATHHFAGGVEAQTAQSIKNLSNVLLEAGSDLSRVVKTTVFLKDMNDFAAFNKVYEQLFEGSKPARSTVEVARLPKDAVVEIEAIALPK
ncbi:putative endoribonuclease L-PSP [Atractiella rhizophila]|nr:putative endoribonuclease L-PSP [Atractiella rhizophila]